MSRFEINLDGLVGPTHNYAGLAYGNVASENNAGMASNPRAAALQGLEKMHLLMQLGVKQMVMPPHPRPAHRWLARMGFSGNLREQINAVARTAPQLLAYAYSASGMWAANAATVCPSSESKDGGVHFTPANLISTAHRALEPIFTALALKRLFPGECFTHHEPLPANALLSDEGAANHMRLIPPGGKAIHMFIYGREGVGPMQYSSRFPARHTLAASEAVARLSGIAQEQTVYARQNPAAIDAGVFHNDVIATSHEHLLLYHEEAFAKGDTPVGVLQAAANGGLAVVRVESKRVSMADAVKTYLFNSQIVSVGQGMTMIAPKECEEHADIRALLNEFTADEANPISEVRFVDLRESMRNGGGPACLRLRVQLTEEEWESVHRPAILTHDLYNRLKLWIATHYRERVAPQDLADPELALESFAALDELCGILHLKGMYDFQH